MRRRILALALAACSAERPPTKEQLGKRVFLDSHLSEPEGQACADCHRPDRAFRDPESERSTSMGAMAGRFGPRNAPTAMYAAFVPPLHFDETSQRWIGGLFWDGRAATLEEQAGAPMVNPLEMNNRDRAAVVAHVREAPYARAFRELYGPRALDDVDLAFARITDVLAAYERSAELSPFSSKYDRYKLGAATLDASETRGLALFEAHCASCHPPPLFTDFGYANLGLPRYPNNRFYVQAHEFNPEGEAFVDRGLGKTVGDPAQDGKFRVPTLRNVAVTPPYGHSGGFQNLRLFLDFLNTRDVGSRAAATCSRLHGADTRCAWPPPEVPATVDRRVGHLGLSDDDVTDLAAFLDTLTDH